VDLIELVEHVLELAGFVSAPDGQTGRCRHVPLLLAQGQMRRAGSWVGRSNGYGLIP